MTTTTEEERAHELLVALAQSGKLELFSGSRHSSAAGLASQSVMYVGTLYRGFVKMYESK